MRGAQQRESGRDSSFEKLRDVQWEPGTRLSSRFLNFDLANHIERGCERGQSWPQLSSPVFFFQLPNVEVTESLRSRIGSLNFDDLASL